MHLEDGFSPAAVLGVSVPVRGMDCIAMERSIFYGKRVSVPVRGMDCIGRLPVHVTCLFEFQSP